MRAIAPGCDGCLGSGRCWVCLGTGSFDMRHRTGACTRCAGSGLCTVCKPEPIVVWVPDQRPVSLIETSTELAS